MTDPTPLPDQQLNDRAVQILSNEGAQCGDCGDEPGDRICPDCEKCRARYVTALRAAGWAPQDEGLAGEVRRLRAEVERWRRTAYQVACTHESDASAAGPAERAVEEQPETGTGQCGHDDYHGAHEWADRPGVWCPGHSVTDDQPASVPGL
ncbi:hypothetical protein [Streptomyces mirabilis]|uniref:hypothetical protein n=1 Tax=Streptomyces mirabilis TaxID=68239 RepID=UPI0033EB62B1